MRIEILGPCEQPLHHDDDYALKFELSSVGIWTLVEESIYPRSAILVRQADQPDHPWGIPAGRPEVFDESPVMTAHRELGEETGIWLPNERFKYIYFQVLRRIGPKRGQLIYSVNLNLNEIPLNNPEETEGGVLFDPGPEIIEKGEIDKLALVPLEKVTLRESSIAINYHYWSAVPNFNNALIRTLGIENATHILRQ